MVSPTNILLYHTLLFRISDSTWVADSPDRDFIVTRSVPGTSEISECDCDQLRLNLVPLIEATTSFAKLLPRWELLIQNLVEDLIERYSNVHTRIGLATFTDKPIPFRGQGPYGNFQSYAYDYCYSLHLPLSTYDSHIFQMSLDDLSRHLVSGQDAMQGQLEALLFTGLDENMLWETDPDYCTHQAILLLTANEQHRPRDGWSSRNDWNWERSYPNGYANASLGGFGSDDFPNLGSLNLVTEEDHADYNALAEYFRIMDGFAAEAPGFESNITQEQLNDFLRLIEKFGPFPYPAAEYASHPGDLSVPECDLSEYPGPSIVGSALSKRSITPILFVTPNVHNYYLNQVTDLGVDAAVIEMDSDTKIESLTDSLMSSLGLFSCFSSTLSPPSSSEASRQLSAGASSALSTTLPPALSSKPLNTLSFSL